MHLQNNAAFSSDGLYFACINEKEDLLVWETASSELINTDFVCNVNTCTCIRWISKEHEHNNKKKPKLSPGHISDETLLAAGNLKGDVLIYNLGTKNLFLHLAGRHRGAINDMCLYTKNNSLFTCSNDQHIAIWDISTGKQISKWKAGDNPVSSICVIDDENLLSSSIEILWWSISQNTILKKFSGHTTEIIKLLPVNVASMNSLYFLSAAVDDTKINAWSLTSGASEASVASFSLPLSPEDIDISKISSKNKPLVLSAVTKGGHLLIFEHPLNGNISEFVQPKVSVEINPDIKDFAILSVKLLNEADECIVAYGSNKSAIAFKHVKIKELLQKNKRENVLPVKNQASLKMPLVNESSKSGKISPVNGLNDSVSSRLKSRSNSSLVVPNLSNPNEKEASVKQLVNEEVDLNNPKETVSILLKAIETQNNNIIEIIFKNSDTEYISKVVENLPTSSLKNVLQELNRRLLLKSSATLYRWLKEILRIHLRYLSQCDDAIESLNQSRKLLSSMNISQTLHKMTVLSGLLNLQVQDSSSDESDSSDEESMEL